MEDLKKQKSTADSTALTGEQLEAVSGGSPSLWDTLGPAIEEVVNAKLPGTSVVCSCTCSTY